jgi:hypothetical protein
VTEFNCGNGRTCLPLERVCDLVNDCGNFEDEPRELCGSQHCARDNGGCSQRCTDTAHGHHCSCWPGYYLDANNTCQGHSSYFHLLLLLVYLFLVWCWFLSFSPHFLICSVFQTDPFLCLCLSLS